MIIVIYVIISQINHPFLGWRRIVANILVCFLNFLLFPNRPSLLSSDEVSPSTFFYDYIIAIFNRLCNIGKFIWTVRIWFNLSFDIDKRFSCRFLLIVENPHSTFAELAWITKIISITIFILGYNASSYVISQHHSIY